MWKIYENICKVNFDGCFTIANEKNKQQIRFIIYQM